MNLDKMSVEELIFLLEVVTKDNPHKPLASATQLLGLCKAIQEIKQENKKLKTQLDNTRALAGL